MSTSPLSVILEGSPYLLIPLAILAVAVGLWYYRRTNPALPVFLRTILTILRVSALLLSIFLIFHLSFSFVRKVQRLPELAIIIDNSASVSSSKDLITKAILNTKNLDQLGKSFGLRFFSFSDTLSEIQEKQLDSLAFDGSATDIHSALTNIGSVIDPSEGRILLLSDGAYNQGANPVRAPEKCPVPIYTVALGDSTPPQDLTVSRIEVNPVVYFKDEIPLTVEIQGFPDAMTAVSLEDEKGLVIARKTVDFRSGGMSKPVSFSFTPDSVGTRIYTLQLTPSEKESSIDNNTRHFSLKVLESRIKVLLVSSAPSPDLAFLKRILQKNDNIELTDLTEKTPGRFYRTSALPQPSNFDVIILLDYPASDSDRQFTGQLISAINSGTATVIFPRNSFDHRLLQPLQHLLPCVFSAKSPEIAVKLAPESDIPPLINFFPTNIAWESLPPVTARKGWLKFRSESTVLLRLDNGDTAIAYSHLAGSKIIALAVYDLWKLSLQDAEHSSGDSLITNFWQSAMRWLAIRQEEDLFLIRTDKTIYSAGENIQFQARLYDENYRLVEEAQLNLDIETPAGNIPLQFKLFSGGGYQASLRLFQTGNYRYQGLAVIGGDTLKTSGELMVESFNPEFIDPVMKPEVLRGIGAASGGNFYFFQDFGKFLDDNKSTPISEEVEHKVDFFPELWALLALIAVLSAEWIIRKRKGLL